MEPFNVHTGIVAPLDRPNVDTDLIIPKQFLKSVKRSGFGENLFDQLRYLDEGEPGGDNSARPLNKDFILNRPGFETSSILLARENFGCGSSREHAPWALLDFGFKVIIAPSFADIFYNNCFKNGILAMQLPSATVDRLFEQADKVSGFTLTVSLPDQSVSFGDGEHITFEIEDSKKQCLLKGLDDIGLTLEKAPLIKAHEKRKKDSHPWLFEDL